MMNMDTIIKWILILSSLTQVCVARSKDMDTRLEHHIKRRSLREDGFTDFQTATIQLSYSHGDRIQRSIRSSRRFRDVMKLTEKPETVYLSVLGEDVNFEITLTHAKSVLNKNARVWVTHGDESSRLPHRTSDCLLSGTVEGDETKPAVMSYCDKLTGWIIVGKDYYSIETIDETDDLETVAIARGKPFDFIDDVIPNDVIREFEPNNIEDSEEDCDLDNNRVKREIVERDPITIETVVIVDEAFVAGLQERGYDTNDSMLNFMTLTWMGVQYEWGRESQLGYNVTIEIDAIQFLSENPTWYTPDPNDLSKALKYCDNSNAQGLWTEYDHVHVFTTSNYVTKGKAYESDICVDGKKCAVSTGFNPVAPVVAAHELGHCMGMSHDLDAGCGIADGLMGYSAKTGWSLCSKSALHNTVLVLNYYGNDCLYANNVDKTANIETWDALPGLVYNDDEMCELLYGTDYKYRDFPGNNPHNCVQFSCINMNKDSEDYGISLRETSPIPGRYCGDEMVCVLEMNTASSYQCVPWADTELDLSSLDKIVGGWTEWSTESACSRTCGTSVKYRQRTCTNPMPLNTAGCDGDSVIVTDCDTEPCPGDSTDDAEVIDQRASEICTHWKANDLYELIGKNSSLYLNTGSVYSDNDFGQCEIHCDMTGNKNAGNNERHGLMPDGTACTHESLPSDAEKFKLPRWSGMPGRCVMGYCELLDCTGVTGDLRNDGCGICGGDNSSCQPYDSVYTTPLAKDEEDLIVVIPANATLIQFHFPYNDMKKFFLEVVMKDAPDTKVISASNDDTRNNPVSFAGTHWYYVKLQQYLYAYGPTDQAVFVQVVNSGDAENLGIHYGYSLPPAEERDVCSGQCDNGGTWNQSTCSCECGVDFYGLTCSDTCWKFCKNSQQFTTSGCKCDCTGRTYGTSCDCRYPFTGKDCQDCKITECYNGGTFDSANCRCECRKGYGGLDCSGPCEDGNNDTETCLINEGKGWCEKKNEQMEEECYMTCGLCEPGPPDTTTTSTSTQETTTTSTSQETTSTTTSTTQETTSTTTSTTQETTSTTTATTPETTSTTTLTTSQTTPGTATTTSQAPGSTATTPTTASITSTQQTTTMTSGTTNKPKGNVCSRRTRNINRQNQQVLKNPLLGTGDLQFGRELEKPLLGTVDFRFGRGVPGGS